MRRIALLLALLLVGFHVEAQPRPLLILISFDGFRWDYPDKAPTPNLRGLMARGVRAEGLIPSFPSKTFPNHYTIVTGLYPSHHGIIANTIKDPPTGRVFAVTKVQEVQDPMWWGGEPIWVAAERAGLVTGAMYWPGSEAPITGVRPRYWNAFSQARPPNDRVDAVLQWLDLPPPERPNFITLYFDDVDTAGHTYGPDSHEVAEAIAHVDAYLGRLLRGLAQRSLLDRANIIVTADHGMAATNNQRVVVLNDYISADDVEVIDINPTLGLFPQQGKGDAVYRALEHASPRLKVYRRESTPEHLHYRDHPRIPPIVGVADEGWQVLQRVTVQSILLGQVRPTLGQHGYDPVTTRSMRGIFVAAGPAFKTNATVPAFENIHIYNGLAQILGIRPAPNDGDPAVARRFLK
jgi:predicted AlkP superfamily pyrophosphatase or phosphodiesterase